MLINFSVRPSNGLTFQGGINSGKNVQDICEITRKTARADDQRGR